MVRAQIVLDEPTADRLRSVSAQTGASMSEVVRQALTLYFQRTPPDTSWFGCLKADPGISHDWDDIDASLAAARRQNPQL